MRACSETETTMEWVGWTTKVLGAFGQRIFKRWLFDAELLGAQRTIYTFEREDYSPYMDVAVSVRVHNRNAAPTTVHVRSIAVRLANGSRVMLERAVMVRPGPVRSPEDMAGFNSYEVSGSSTAELTLSTRKYNPPDLKEYLEEAAPQIELELGETFGNRRKLTGAIKFGGLYKH